VIFNREVLAEEGGKSCHGDKKTDKGIEADRKSIAGFV
jgi:hypothetical protein